MTGRGTTGAGRPQIAGVPRVHRFRELDGRGTTGNIILTSRSNQGWLQSNSLVETTSNDPRQYGGERSEVILSLDEVVAWLEAVRWTGDNRKDQMSLRQQCEEEKVKECKPQE